MIGKKYIDTLKNLCINQTAGYVSFRWDLGCGKLKILSASAQNGYQVRNYEQTKHKNNKKKLNTC